MLTNIGHEMNDNFIIIFLNCSRYIEEIFFSSFWAAQKIKTKQFYRLIGNCISPLLSCQYFFTFRKSPFIALPEYVIYKIADLGHNLPTEVIKLDYLFVKFGIDPVQLFSVCSLVGVFKK